MTTYAEVRDRGMLKQYAFPHLYGVCANWQSVDVRSWTAARKLIGGCIPPRGFDGKFLSLVNVTHPGHE